MTKRQGWYTDIGNSEYHSGPGISKSGLMELLRSPAHFKAPQKPPTPAMVQGEAFHLYTLERDLFDKRFAVMPQGQDGRTKEGKARVADAAARNQVAIPYDVFQNIKGMRDAIWAHPKIAEILSEGQAEVSGYFHHPDFPDILSKIRPDWIHTSRNLLLDLKSTGDSRERKFTSIAYDKAYYLQAAYYCLGAQLITGVEHEFYFAAVEADPPHGVILYQAGQDMFVEGRERVALALTIYRHCMETGSWPAYTQDIQVLGLPGWVRRKDMILG